VAKTEIQCIKPHIKLCFGVVEFVPYWSKIIELVVDLILARVTTSIRQCLITCSFVEKLLEYMLLCMVDWCGDVSF
jgi:hypothetical protein